MQIDIPNQNSPIIRQLNIGEKFGEIWASWNLDLFSNLGKIRISPRTKAINTTTDIATLVTPVAFIRTDARGSDEWWALCDQGLVRTNAVSNPISASWIADNTSSSPTTNLSRLYSDMVEFNGALIVTLNNGNIARLASGTWNTGWWVTTLGQSALTTSIPVPLCVGFDSKLYIGNANVVYSVDISNNVATAMTFKSSYQVTWIKSSKSAIWVGCKHKYSGLAKVFVFYGKSTNFDDDYEIENSDNVYSCVIKNDIPYVISSSGIVSRFNGGGFLEVARFPIANEKYFGLVTPTKPPVDKNGMAIINNRINILIAPYANTNIQLLHNQPAGIWELDEDNRTLYHKYSLSNTLTAGTKDFGSPMIAEAGALVRTSKLYGEFLAGYQVVTDVTPTNISAISYLDIFNSSGTKTDNVLKTGFIITSKIYSSNIEEAWQKFYTKFEKLFNSTDKIILKYRSDDKEYSNNQGYKVCTWASDTTFTSSSSQAWSDVSVGDELEIIAGCGAGLSVKITNLSLNAGTYTITIDTAVTSASGNFGARVGNWTQVGSITNQNIKHYDFSISGINSTWIQFKIILFGKGNSPQIEELSVISNSSVKKE